MAWRRERITERDVPESQHTIFVRGLPGSMTTDEVREFFEDKYGEISFDFVKVSPDRSKLYIAVRFETKSSARECMEKYANSEILGYRVELTWFRDIRRYINHCQKQGVRRNGRPGRDRGDDERRRDSKRSRTRSLTHSPNRSLSRDGSRSQSRERVSRSLSRGTHSPPSRSRSRSTVRSSSPNDHNKTTSTLAADSKRDMSVSPSPPPPPPKKVKKTKKDKKRKRRHSPSLSRSASPPQRGTVSRGAATMNRRLAGSDMEESEGELPASEHGVPSPNKFSASGPLGSVVMKNPLNSNVGGAVGLATSAAIAGLQQQQQQTGTLSYQQQIGPGYGTITSDITGQQLIGPTKKAMTNLSSMGLQPSIISGGIGPGAPSQLLLSSQQQQKLLFQHQQQQQQQQQQDIKPPTSASVKPNYTIRNSSLTIDLDSNQPPLQKVKQIGIGSIYDDLMVHHQNGSMSSSTATAKGVFRPIGGGSGGGAADLYGGGAGGGGGGRRAIPADGGHHSTKEEQTGELITAAGAAMTNFKNIQKAILNDVRYKPTSESRDKQQPAGTLRLSSLSTQKTSEAVRDEKIAKLSPELRERVERKKLELELNYRTDCETYGFVVQKLISKDRSLEDRVRLTLLEVMRDLEAETMKQLDNYLDQVFSLVFCSAD